MEIAAYIAGIGAVVVFGIAALLGVLHMRDASIWTTWAACLLTLTGGFCWLQDREWKKDTVRAPNARPRLEIAQIGFDYDAPDQTLNIKLTVENVGDAAASDVTLRDIGYIARQPLTEVPAIEPVKIPAPPLKTMSPGRRIVRATPVKNITPEFVNEVRKGQTFLYIYGVITYVDRTSTEVYHQRKFCAQYDSAARLFLECPFHNSED